MLLDKNDYANCEGLIETIKSKIWLVQCWYIDKVNNEMI